LPFENIIQVICGLGQRHIEIASFLLLRLNSFSHLLGDGTKLDDRDHNYVFLTSGNRAHRKFISRTGMREGIITLFKSLPARTLVCTGRPVIRYLGEKVAYSASLYTIEEGRLTKKVSFGEAATE